MDESYLIEQAVKGDLDAFNALVMMYQSVAFNLAYRILGSQAPAEDATQEAVISMYRNLGSYRGGSFKSWFLRIVTNACYDELRRQKRHPNIPLEPEDDDGELIEDPAWMQDDSPGPEEVYTSAQMMAAIQSCLDRLEEKFRVVVALVDIAGEDYQSVALVIKRPIGTVKSRLARARLKMQDCLRGFGELLPAKFRLNGEDNND